MKKVIIFSLIVLSLIVPTQVFANIQLDTPDKNLNYIDSNGSHVISPYKITQNATAVTLETKEGSYVFNSNTCSLATFGSGIINGTQPLIKSDSYQVLSSNTNNGTTNWNPVGMINNAQCIISVQTNATTVSITGTKSVAGAGQFSVTYTKMVGIPIKISFSATNNNPAWTDRHVGLRETLASPQFITVGDQTFDLSQYNNTVLNRAWITNHSGQIIKLYSNLAYNMGVGWNHLNQITVHWINGMATLDFDYNYNTPILSPGNTITIDPSISLDTLGTNASWAASTNATQTISITITSHPHQIIVVGIEDQCNLINYNANTCGFSSVKIGSDSFTKITNKTIGVTATKGLNTEFWYYKNPPTGAVHITLTPINAIGDGNGHTGGANGYSLYNVDQTTPVVASNTNSSTSKGVVQTLTTTSQNSWIMDSLFFYDSGAGSSVSNPSFTQAWNINQGSAYISASQYNSSPTLGSSNKFTWQGISAKPWVEAGIQVKSLTPPTPTISKFNTINSTAINATWANATGAHWFWFNVTLSGGATTHINTTSLFKLLNNYTAGSKYTASLVAGNSSGKSGSSITKYNYTYNIAPTSLAAPVLTKTTAQITWVNPTGNFSGFKVEKQPNHGSWSTVVSNTGNTLNNYNLTSLTSGQSYGVRISTNYAAGSNYSGTSSPSTILNFTTPQSTTASPVLYSNVVGDVVQLNGTTTITNASPSPVVLNQVKLFLNGSLYNTTSLSHNIANGSSYNFTWWYQFSNGNSQTFKYQARVTNSTGNPDQSNVSFNSSNIVTSRQYNPDYATAKTPSLGLVNYTINRPVPGTIILAANRDLGGTVFPMECLYQTSSQAITGGSTGTWVNKTNVGYWYQSQSVSRSEVYYITCYDPNEELFNTRSLVNGSSVLFGIQGFDNTFGAFLGLPVGVFFVVMAAALGNRRTAPMWVVIILAIAGLMATIGFFTLDQNIWYLAIIAGLLGLFVGRKLF